MATRSFKWSRLAQARRIIGCDLRYYGIDMILGFGYVLAGFYLLDVDGTPVHVVVLPCIILALVMCYLTYCFCKPEGPSPTAMFYFNLPRNRRMTFWVRVIVMGAYALFLDVVIGAGIFMKLNSPVPDQQFVITFFLLVMPFYAIAIGMFISHAYNDTIIRNFDIVIQLGGILGFAFLLVLECVFYRNLSDRPLEFDMHTTLYNYLSPGLILGILTVISLWSAYRHWMKIQVGEDM